MTKCSIIICCLGLMAHGVFADDDKPTDGPAVENSADGNNTDIANNKENTAPPAGKGDGKTEPSPNGDAPVDVAGKGDGAGDVKPDYPAGFESLEQRISYAVGVSVGRGLQKDGAKLDVSTVAKGFHDAYTGGELQLSNEQIRESIIALKMQLAAIETKAGDTVEAENKPNP